MSNETLEYVTALSTGVAAVGTLLAVLAALYLNIWRERRLRPKLSLAIGSRAQIGVGFARDPDASEFFQPVAFELSNAVRHHTASDTEVLLTVETDSQGAAQTDPPQRFTHVSDRPLAWTFGPRPTAIAEPRIDVPPGVTRTLTIAYIGHPWSIAEAIPPGAPIPQAAKPSWIEVLGAFNVYPLEQASMERIGDETYHLTFVVTARDTDARRYTTDLSFAIEDQGGYRLAGVRWTPLREVSG